MPKPKSQAFIRIRAEVIRLVGLIPAGKFTTYGSVALHMNVAPRQVAMVLSRLTKEESLILPWHRVVSAEARLSQNMPMDLALEQKSRLVAEGFTFDDRAYIKNADEHFHVVGVHRQIRWSDPDLGV